MKMKKTLALFSSVFIVSVVLSGCTSISGGGTLESVKEGKKASFAFTARTVEKVDVVSSASLYKAKGQCQINDHGIKYKLHGEVLWQKGYNFESVGSGFGAFVDTDKDDKYEKMIKICGFDGGEGKNETITSVFYGLPIEGDNVLIEVYNIEEYDGTGEPIPVGEPEYKNYGPLKGGNIQIFDK